MLSRGWAESTAALASGATSSRNTESGNTCELEGKS
jgi:hypothetical protein